MVRPAPVEETSQQFNPHPKVAERFFALFFSVILHPVFIPLYVAAYLAFIHPDIFTGFSHEARQRTMVILIVNLFFFPALSILLLRAVGFISSIHLPQRRDRIIPLIAVGIFYFWAYLVFRQQPQYPELLVAFLLGIFLTASAALIANVYLKISLHGLGMGGAIGFFLVMLYIGDLNDAWPLALSLFAAGIAGTARLLISTHVPREYYAGLLLGIIAQPIAAVYIL